VGEDLLPIVNSRSPPERLKSFSRAGSRGEATKPPVFTGGFFVRNADTLYCRTFHKTETHYGLITDYIHANLRGYLKYNLICVEMIYYLG
jgi:hypothetical protein